MKKSTTETTFSSEVIAAAEEFISLKSRKTNPDGKFDKGGRWYPAVKCECCVYIRTPSLAFPYSYLTHCRTAEHVANAHNVDVKEVRKCARKLQADSSN